MNLRRHRLAALCWLVAALLMLSCGPGSIEMPRTVVVTTAPTPAAPVITVVVTSARPVVGQQTQLPRSLPADTAQSPASATLAPTDTPQALPSPTPATRAVQPISPVNAGQVMLLDRLGTGALQDMAWLPDGQTVVAAFYSGLSLCDAGTLRELKFIPAYGWKSRLAASPDGRHVALIAEDGVQLWDTSSGQMVQALEAPSGGAKLIAFGARGQVLAISGPGVEGEPSSETVGVWDIAGVLDGSAPAGRLLYRLEGFASGLSGLAFSPDGGVLVTTRWYDSSQADGTTYLGLWDATTGEPLPLEGDLGTASDGLQHLAFTPDGRLLVGDESFNIHIWDTATGKLLRTLVNDSSTYSLALSADGRWLAAGSPDKAARVWDVSAGVLRTMLSGHTDWVIGVAFAPSSQAGTALLATATTRDGVQLWDLEDGRQVAARPPCLGPSQGSH